MDNLIISYGSISGTSLFLEDQNLILVSAETLDLYPNTTLVVNTGISLYFTDKYSGILTNRQIQAENKILLPMAGLVYRGICKNISITMTNFSPNPYRIKAGITKVATVQLVGKLRITKNIILEQHDSN